jgi:hypothetical protein
MTKVAIKFGADNRTASQDMRDVAELIIALTRVSKILARSSSIKILKDYSTCRRTPQLLSTKQPDGRHDVGKRVRLSSLAEVH